MTTIDERGRAAASELRRSMDHGFDVEAGLDELLRGDPVAGSSEPQRARRGWMLAAAAITALAVGAVGVLATREDDGPVSDTPAPATTASVAPATTSPSDTTVAPEVVSETTLVPDTAVTTTPAPVDRTVRVADVAQVVEPRRTVLAAAGFGSGPGELGVEECQECDPARPWAPVAIPFGPRGKVLIADTANRRWVMFEPEDPDAAVSPWVATETSWPDGAIVSSQPVVDESGTVYAVMYGPLGAGGTNAYELWTFGWRDLTEPTGRSPVASAGNAPITLGPTSVAVGGQVIDGLVPSMGDVSDAAVILGRADPAAGTPAQLIIDRDGSSTTFAYETDETVSLYGPSPVLFDDSVLTVRTGLDGEIVDRLFVDGRVARLELPPSGALSGAAFANANGFVRLEVSADGSRWEIARYELPLTVYTTVQPAGERAAAVFATVVAPDAESYLAAARAALGTEYRDDCTDPSVADPTGTWVDVSGGFSDAIATFEIRIGCDDSGAGYRWVAEMNAGGDGWRATSVGEQIICARGVAVAGDRELCI